MAFDHQLLTPDQLGPTVLPVVGDAAPAPLQQMVVQGVAPLPPRDLLVALYQFWVKGEDPLAKQAGECVGGLPDTIVQGALADKELPAGVLDFLARKSLNNETRLDSLLRHPKLPDESLIELAKVVSENACETIAGNQTRWLACPKIVESLYQNRNCRMSVIHSVLELAGRQKLELDLPAVDEIFQSLEGESADPERDELFSSAVSGQEEQERWLDQMLSATADDELDLSFMADEVDLAADQAAAVEPEVKQTRTQQLLLMKPAEKVRAALLGDKFDRAVLIRDSNKVVAMATIKSPKIRDDEAISFSSNRSLSRDVLGYIANRRDWVKLYAIKLNLVMNPKTPLSKSMAFLAHLHNGDVQKIARSKNIPSALAAAAKRKLAARS